MRLTFTVIDPAARRRADVVLDAVPEATASRVGAALTGMLRPGSPRAGSPRATLYVEGTAVDPVRHPAARGRPGQPG